MFFIVICSLLSTIWFSYLSYNCFKKAKLLAETSAADSAANKSLGKIFLVVVAVFFCLTIFLSWGAYDYAANPPIRNSSSKKEKCSWCGKMVDSDDMIGNWCRDCSNDAFGHGGWYNK